MAGLVKLAGFDEAVRRHTWTGETLPVPYHGPVLCSHCSAGTLIPVDPYVAEPLFRHGGYGEAKKITAAWCGACNRTTITRVESIRPMAGAT